MSFSVIMADPPWRYSFSRSKSRAIERQYPTMTQAEIEAFGSCLAGERDAALFLWATAPKLPEALAAMAAWGFLYKTHAVWDKMRLGMGYWWRGRHELLLCGTRGRASPPPPSLRDGSIFHERAREHSRKPEAAYRSIERGFPSAPLVELFARRERPRWLCYGHGLSAVQPPLGGLSDAASLL